MTEAANLARLSAAELEARIELWFFRDINDEARRKLITLCLGQKVADEATPHDWQRKCLHHILRSGRLVPLPSVEDMARVIFPILWNKECYNGVRLQDIDQYRIGGSRSMGGRVERYEAEALSLATAIHNHLKGTGDE